MSLKDLFSGREKLSKRLQSSPPANSSSPVCDLFREGIQLKQELTERLIDKAKTGVELFDAYNESRMKLAFESFDITMSMALYEIIYLLNTNEPWLQEHKYRVRRFTGMSVTSESEEMVDLYVKDAPYGVRGICNLSPVFRHHYEEYIQKEYGRSAIPDKNGKHLPIDGIYSIGSIGTIGHKAVASDLDLEVQYDLEPFLFDSNRWTDDTIKTALLKELHRITDRYYHKKQIDKAKTGEETQKKVLTFFKKRLGGKYPILCNYYLGNNEDLLKSIRQSKENKLRSELIREVIDLMKLNARTVLNTGRMEDEERLKLRIQKIQDYIQRKFPDEEIYLFPFSLHEFRKGQFSSTLISKESSGGAYELILNYETLMPGIYFTPNIPSHFLFPSDINNKQDSFDKLIEYLRFGVINIFNNVTNRIINQGPTPDLSLPYVAEHYTAVYWEAFKASYGNLPKATLNLLRYEILLEKAINKTIIQLIKEPDQLDGLVLNEDRIDEMLSLNHLFLPQDAIELEKEFPLLSFDPWWLRYKALKIAYGVPGLIAGVKREDLIEISESIDLAFALHIRLSDVFTKPGDRQTFDKHREKVLRALLSRAFPEHSDQQTKLYATFIGDIETVAEFEKKLRRIFQECIVRVRSKAAKFYVDEKSTQEFEVWHHFYARNFTPHTNMIPRSILNHLQIPRGRVQVGYEENKGWFFKSLQRESMAGKRFASSVLNLLPEQTTLIKDTQFLYGLAYCVINGYYGIYSTGTLKETRTAIEYDQSRSNTGSKYDNHLAFVRPDQIERIMQLITKLSTPIKVGYLDCITKKRKIIAVIVFLNLQKYGRISILYRDNLDTLYLDTYDISSMEKAADKLIASYQKLLKAVPVHKVLGQFFRNKKVNLEEVDLYTWVNTNCVETTHASTNDLAKERDLSSTFKEIILKVHATGAA